MDPNTLTDEELLALYERLQQEVANRQTRRAIADEIVDHVDRIIAGAPEAMSGEFEVGRLKVDPGHVAVVRAAPEEPEEPADDPKPELETMSRESPAPVPWKPGMRVRAGDYVTYQDETYRVIQTHDTAAHWLPPELPALYAKED